MKSQQYLPGTLLTSCSRTRFFASDCDFVANRLQLEMRKHFEIVLIIFTRL